MKQLKIGILGSRGIPNHYGGFEQFAQYLSEGLLQRGHEVWVYNSHKHPWQQDNWNGVHIIHCKDPEHRTGTAGQFFYDRNCISDARKRNFDVLLHLGYTSDSVWHRRWPKEAINIVNMDGLEWMRKKYNRITRWFLKRAEGMAAKHADILVADSPAIREHLADKYGKKAFFIPYAAEIFTKPDPGWLEKFQLTPGAYYVAVARMVPENNIEMIIKGYLASGQKCPLVVIGNTDNRFGRHLTSSYDKPGVVFAGPVFNREALNNIRHFSLRYFHGHSAGGTNPSLLEAMACGCDIIAHDNVFNRYVLGDDADYFVNGNSIAQLLKTEMEKNRAERRQKANLDKIRTLYNAEKITDEYEKLMLDALA